MRLSMILPAYNVSGYIDACLESVTQQDIPASDYEIIIVNDGSTDDTPSHIDQWTAKHRNIKVVNQANQGLSAARNNGLKHACGEYIWFIDSDDTICRNCLGGLLDVCDRLRPDMFCVGPSIPFVDDFPVGFNARSCVSGICVGGNWIRSGQAVIGAWCYIINRDFWVSNNLEFVKGISYEDTECMSRSFYFVKKICGLNKFSVYNYIQREGSIMNSKPNLGKLRSHSVIVATLNEFARRIADDNFFVNYYRSIVVGVYVSGLKMMANNKELQHYFPQYMRQVKNAGGVKNTATSLTKRLYRFIAIYFPRLFMRIC